MRQVMELSLVVLTLAVGNLGIPAAAFPKDEGQQSIIKSDVDVVSVYFTVRDSKKHLASQLDQQQFHVFEDGREQPIKFFAHHSDVVLNVAPKEKEEFAWEGEAFIDAAEFQPITVFTRNSRRPPRLVRTMWFDLPGLGFNVDYRRQEDGVWFPSGFGREFQVHVGPVLFFNRDVSISVKNSEFERAHVEAK